ncbi:MAG TPA: hypothetical protein DEQ49_10840 [Arthrobacter bacterium]|nr:hypothetical protein [Arthrobacter sp.]
MPARSKTPKTNPDDHAASDAAEAQSGQSLHATSIREVAAAGGVSTATVSRAVPMYGPVRRPK